MDCDFCHRLVPGPEGEKLIGNARYFVADDYVRRAQIQDAVAPHEWQYSSYFEESALCGLCHDVSNPLQNNFALERTYTEWTQSDFASGGADETCQGCHLPKLLGFAAGARDLAERPVHRHDFVGGNAWMPNVLAGEYPDLDRADSFHETGENARATLRESALLSLALPSEWTPGNDLALTVRVENLTGHKLPTGYPEGRRCWLELSVTDADGRLVFQSGAYDLEQADRLSDPQLRTYEVRMAAGGIEGFHFMKQDEVLADTRIPPRGFFPSSETTPIGRTYARQTDGSMAHWDEAPYTISTGAAQSGSLLVKATLWYQTTSRPYVEFLRDENSTDARGTTLFDLWQAYDRSPPVNIAEVTTSIHEAQSSGCRASTLPRVPSRFVFSAFFGLLLFELCWGRRGRHGCSTTDV